MSVRLFSLHCKPIPCNEKRVFPVKFFSQGYPCNDNRVPAMRKRVPCNENRVFPARKTSQGKPCSGPVLALYGIAVYFKALETNSGSSRISLVPFRIFRGPLFPKPVAGQELFFCRLNSKLALA